MTKKEVTDPIYSNVQINPNKAYVFYVGDVKYIDTTTLLLNRLSQRYNKPVEKINLLPNMPPPYMEGNFVVVNTKLADHILSKENKKYFLPMDQPEINADVSNSPYVRRIAEQILKNQDDIYINLFKSTPEMSLPEKDERMKIIGPKPELFEYFDNKVTQRQIAEEIGMPVPDGYIARNFEELINLYQTKFAGKDAYVACSKGFGGSGSETVHNLEELLTSEKLKNGEEFIIAELLDLESSITTQGIVANENEVVVLGVSDMIMDGVNYKGVIHPSRATPKNMSKLTEYTEIIAKYMGSKGYRGFFNIDFMIDKKDRFFMTEINPRKGGSTPECIVSHHVERPDLVSLPELEFLAVTEETFGNIDISQYKLPSMHWGVKGVKAKKHQKTINYIPKARTEMDIFRNSGLTTLDHPGEGITYLDKGRVTRSVCVLTGDHHERDPREIIWERLLEEEAKIKVA